MLHPSDLSDPLTYSLSRAITTLTISITNHSGSHYKGAFGVFSVGALVYINAIRDAVVCAANTKGRKLGCYTAGEVGLHNCTTGAVWVAEK
ncbi:hypothetical protein Tco_0001012 [Tanacetum coccineum]